MSTPPTAQSSPVRPYRLPFLARFVLTFVALSVVTVPLTWLVVWLVRSSTAGLGGVVVGAGLSVAAGLAAVTAALVRRTPGTMTLDDYFADLAPVGTEQPRAEDDVRTADPVG